MYVLLINTLLRIIRIECSSKHVTEVDFARVTFKSTCSDRWFEADSNAIDPEIKTESATNHEAEINVTGRALFRILSGF